MAIRNNRYTPETADELKDLCRTAGILSPALSAAISETANSCDMCAKPGRLFRTKKVYVKHVNEECNEEIHIEFAF